MEFLQIVHNLSRALAVDASLARLEERSRHVLINDESVCGSCHARLGTKLFAMYPDDTIVCYKVCDDYLTVFFSLYILFSVSIGEILSVPSAPFLAFLLPILLLVFPRRFVCFLDFPTNKYMDNFMWSLIWL